MILPGKKTVTCRECDVVGEVVVRCEIKGKIRILDSVPHKESCSQFVRPQPKHLRSRLSVRTQERRANALVGAHETAASGAVGMDGDGRSFNRWRVESKQTRYGSYAVPQRVWTKLVVGALRVGEEPLLHVELRSGFPYKRICVILKDLYVQWTRCPCDPPRSKFVDPEGLPRELKLDPPAVAVDEAMFELMKAENGT